MGFRNTDEVKHKFKRACTTTAHRKMGGVGEQGMQRGKRECRETFDGVTVYRPRQLQFIYFYIFYEKLYTFS